MVKVIIGPDKQSYDKWKAGIKNLRSVATEDLPEELEEEATRLLELVIKKTPKVTGKARKGWKLRTIDELHYVIENNINYVFYLEYGTRSHTIETDTKDALKFEGEFGRDIYRRIVKHPGIKPLGMLRIAIEESRNYRYGIIDRLKQTLREKWSPKTAAIFVAKNIGKI